MQDAAADVVLVSTQSRWHGGEKQAELLAQGLRQRRHRCRILCRRDGEFHQRMEQQDFEVQTFPGNGRSPQALWQLRNWIRRWQPAVLHYNDSHALTAGAFATWGMAIPLRVVARRVDFPIRAVGRYARAADGLICVSTAVAEICRTAGLRDRCYVVHDGVEPTFAESGQRQRGRQRLELNDDQRLLLTVAKLTDHKGHRFLLEALPTILAEHPNVVLAWAGDGELRAELQQQADALGVASHVRLLGYRDDVADLLAAADLIVQPSHMEGLCSSLIDAMLAARPIVACAAGGIPDLLRTKNGDSSVGWLVPIRDPDALATSINEALCDPDEAAARGAAARQRALSHFTADEMVLATIRAYARLARDKYGDQAACRVPGLSSALESLDAEPRECASSAS